MSGHVGVERRKLWGLGTEDRGSPLLVVAQTHLGSRHFREKS
jgi:hypothetical protein